MIEINLNLYRIFYVAAQSKTIMEASKKLHISQPAVSKSINNLENMLNIKLFSRDSHGITLTPEGKKLFENVEKAYNHLIAGQKLIDDMENLVSGNLTIGVPSHIVCFYLINYLNLFTERYPNIKIRLISTSTTELTKKLYNHELDFIVDSPPINLSGDNIRITKLTELETTFISNNKICDFSKENMSKYKFILPYFNSPMTIELSKILEKNNIQISPIYEVDTTDVIISLVKKGIGIGYVVKNAVKDELKKGEIYEANIDLQLPKLELNLVYMQNYMTKASKVFIKDFLINQVGDEK